MKTIESHLPILERIFKIKPINTVLEFGMGMGSTPFFLNNAKHLTSIEMQSKEWYDRVVDNYGHYSHFKPHIALGPYAYADVTLEPPYDLIFVDGHGDSRWKVINDMFNHTSLMVIHDTQQPSYGWDKVVRPKFWSWMDIREQPTWTTVLTCDMEISEGFLPTYDK